MFGITVSHVIVGAIILFAAIFVWNKIFAKKERPNIYEKVKCPKCGWMGEVSKYSAVCRKCGNTNLTRFPGDKK